MRNRHTWAIAVFLLFFLPLSAFSKGSRAELQKRLEQLSEQIESHQAQLGIRIYSLDRKEDLFARNSDRALMPASNMKLVTTAAALSLLGPDYRFQTRFFGNGSVENGVLKGSLWIQGGGDPCFSERFYPGNALAPLESFLEALIKKGIQKIEGDLVLDDRFFDRDWVPSGWPTDQLTLEYCAPICALALNEGCYNIQVEANPGRRASVRLFPASSSIHFLNEIETEAGRGDPKLHFSYVETNQLRLKGSIHAANANYDGKIAVKDPLLFFGSAVRELLGKKRIVVQGNLRSPNPSEEIPESAFLIYLHRSPIQNVVWVTNKDSDNFHAEHLFKTIAAQVEKEGSWKAGTRAIRRFLRERGIAEAGFTIEDGCGLSRSNRLSADLLVSLLALMENSKIRDNFHQTLPICGEDGTLKTRLDESPYRGRVQAKTGWIQGASSLSGYAQSLQGERFAFSVLINYEGKTNNRIYKGLVDSILRSLIEFDR